MPDTELLVRPAPAPTWRDRVAALRARLAARPAGVVVAGGLGAGAVVIAAAAAVFVVRSPSAAGPAPELVLPRADRGAAVTSSTVAPEVVVHVAGAVARPGLVQVPGGARVADAVAAAGGLRPDADLDRLNLAALLVDGQRVWVPIVGQAPPAEVAPVGDAPASAATAVVDLNSATVAQLEELPGIGPSTAQAIVDQRRRVGRFRSVEDLLDVRGIGPSKLAALRERVRV